MSYQNLEELLEHSQSSRDFFLSLPVELQRDLHRHSDYIHTAAQLHGRAASVQELNRLEELSRRLEKKMKNSSPFSPGA
ncbi:MAG TPA: hypothetical protein H9662_07830 [Firmicutes bacterium]|nr:hypothetical protein [Bacillota bacterium]